MGDLIEFLRIDFLTHLATFLMFVREFEISHCDLIEFFSIDFCNTFGYLFQCNISQGKLDLTMITFSLSTLGSFTYNLLILLLYFLMI